MASTSEQPTLGLRWNHRTGRLQQAWTIMVFDGVKVVDQRTEWRDVETYYGESSVPDSNGEP